MLLAWPGSCPWLPAATDKISVIYFDIEVNLAFLWEKHSWLFDMVSTPQPTGRCLSLALFEFFGSLVFWLDRGPYLTIYLLTPYMILFLDGLESFLNLFSFLFVEGYTKMAKLYHSMTHWIMVQISHICWDLIVPKC